MLPEFPVDVGLALDLDHAEEGRLLGKDIADEGTCLVAETNRAAVLSLDVYRHADVLLERVEHFKLNHRGVFLLFPLGDALENKNKYLLLKNFFLLLTCLSVTPLRTDVWTILSAKDPPTAESDGCLGRLAGG